MSRFNKTVVSTMLGTALTGGLLMAGASPAAAATCPSGASPVINGAKASWTLRCSGGTLSVYGWVEDTRADGKCAKIIAMATVTSGPYRHDFSACGWGVRKNFDWKFQGKRAPT
jgi:hypothetical protein